MRLIDADALKRKAQKVSTEAWKMRLQANVETVLNQFIDWVEDAPTIEPGQKTGHWIPWKAYYGKDRKSWSDELKCSKCGYKWGDEEYKFCPNCGARMEREEE